MTSPTDATNPNDSHRADDHTAHVRVEDGILVYDVENPTAWIQADTAVSLMAHR